MTPAVGCLTKLLVGAGLDGLLDVVLLDGLIGFLRFVLLGLETPEYLVARNRVPAGTGLEDGQGKLSGQPLGNLSDFFCNSFTDEGNMQVKFVAPQEDMIDFLGSNSLSGPPPRTSALIWPQL